LSEADATTSREFDPDDAEPGDYLRAVEGGDYALHVYLSDDKEWWLAHNPDESPTGAFNYVNYQGEETHSVHEATLVAIEDAPEFVRGEFDAE